ncbi:MAG: hypothetical protein AAF921_05170 [Cyanobacteria bacterium P01_D01_bin.44]
MLKVNRSDQTGAAAGPMPAPGAAAVRELEPSPLLWITGGLRLFGHQVARRVRADSA